MCQCVRVEGGLRWVRTGVALHVQRVLELELNVTLTAVLEVVEHDRTDTDVLSDNQQGVRKWDQQRETCCGSLFAQ